MWSDQICVDEVGIGTLDGVVELHTFLLTEFLSEVVVKLLFVRSRLQRVPDHVDLVQVQLHVIPAADDGEDRNRLVTPVSFHSGVLLLSLRLGLFLIL